MVIVVFHALASAFVYIRDRFRMGYFNYLTPRNGNNSQCGTGDSNNSSCFQWLSGRRLGFQQDAFTPLLDASDVTELRDAIANSVTQCLPRVERVVVFLKDPITELIEADNLGLPTHGVIWDAYQERSLHIDSVPPDPDPVLELLKLHPSVSNKILFLPISSRNNDHCLGIVVACVRGDGLSIEEDKCLKFLQKQVSVAYAAVQQSLEESGTDQQESLMRLCGDLHDQDAASLELKVIRYLREQTDAESGFLLLVVPETLELISQVVGNTILPEEVRFPGLWSCFAQALETKRPMALEHIPQDRRGEVEKIVEMKVHSFLCVPVARKGSEDLIALACLVNKINDNKFSDTDIQIVKQCFTYTATVLTSTLAFQNERKLKNQTQALLHVARKLFTRLGECDKESDKKSKQSTVVFSVTRFIHSFCIRYFEKELEAEQHRKSTTTARRASKTKSMTLYDGVDLLLHAHEKCLDHTVPQDPHKGSSIVADDDIRRFIEKRKRKMSQSFFYMYDPTSLEAESSSDEESESSSEDDSLILRKNNSPIVQKNDSPSKQLSRLKRPDIILEVDSSSSSSDDQGYLWFTPNKRENSSKATVDKFNLKDLLSPIVSYPFGESQDNQLPSHSQHIKLSAQLLSPLSKERQDTRTSQVRTFSRSMRKRSSMRKHVPFSHLRTLPAAYFALPDGTVSPYIELLRHYAPSDAAYSDGDFMYDLTKLLREIMQEARNLTDSERCSVFLIDQDSDELVATVFDGITTNNKEWQLRNGVQSEIRLPKTQGIAGHVATTGTLLNIKDAYSHPLFYRGIDDSTGFRTRNILCFPIKDEEGVVLGVAQLCNKKTGTYFTTFDEDIASAFAVYCCISISHSLMYKKVIDIQYRNSLANELMMFHMKCLIYKKLQDTQHRQKLANELLRFQMQQIPMEEVQDLANQDLPRVQVFHKDFNKFSFPPRMMADTRTAAACRAMCEDLGFISRWRLKSDTLARFLLMVKKGYRNPPYHNWMHAFSVAHFGYLCIKNLQLASYLEDIELFALFVSCLCHDIDHRGTTNSFQVKSQSVLAALYSSEGSVMERHHLAQSMCILNTEGSNIFENLSSKEYQQVLDLMRDIILATDVAHHLRIFTSLEEMAQNGYRKSDPKCRNLLLCLLMTASDLSDQTKTWSNTKHIAVLIYQEFFSQGDLEKALGESPLEMMDRERACVPDLQISFLDNIAIPVYRVLAMIFPQAKTVRECVENNRKHWERKAQLMKVHNNSAQTMSVQEIIALGEDSEEEEEVKMDTNQHNGR